MDDVASDGVLEEQFAGAGTGVELEQAPDADDQAGIRPWDPEKIRVTTKTFSLRNILDMIDTDDLELAPDFQRNKVWKARQKSRLIESLLLQIPLPAFYFAEDADGLLRVVDGLQRLSTIHAFVRHQTFPLRDLEYLERDGEIFSDLSQSLQRRLLNAQFVVHVIDPSTPGEVKYDIFKRINTGGEPLNGMEIRHCISKPRSRHFLKRCVESEDFHRATGGKLRGHIRMHDREAALRFVAFSLLGDLDDYDEHGTLERLLDWAVGQLDDEKEVTDEALEVMLVDFERSMRNADAVFGDHAFRKWPIGTQRLSPINRALFETWSVVLSQVDTTRLAGRVSDTIVAQARQEMTSTRDYIDAISTSTSQPSKVKLRFDVPRRILAEADL